jgi:hypothetical protein
MLRVRVTAESDSLEAITITESKFVIVEKFYRIQTYKGIVSLSNFIKKLNYHIVLPYARVEHLKGVPTNVYILQKMLYHFFCQKHQHDVPNNCVCKQHLRDLAKYLHSNNYF